MQKSATTPNPPSALARDATAVSRSGSAVFGSLNYVSISKPTVYDHADNIRREVESEGERRSQQDEGEIWQ